MTTNHRLVPDYVRQQMALAPHARFRSKDLAKVEAVNACWKNLLITLDASAANTMTFTSTGAAIPADGNLANGTTHAQADIIKTAVIDYYINRQTSMMEDTDEDDNIIGTFVVNGGAAVTIHLTHQWVTDAFREACTDATANPNAWDRAAFYFRRIMRWSTRDADARITANGHIPSMCQKYAIPLEFKRMAYDFCHISLLTPVPSGFQIGAFHAYYQQATAQNAQQMFTTHNTGVTRGRYNTQLGRTA